MLISCTSSREVAPVQNPIFSQGKHLPHPPSTQIRVFVGFQTHPNPNTTIFHQTLSKHNLSKYRITRSLPLYSHPFQIEEGLERTPKFRSFRGFKLNFCTNSGTPSPKSSKGSSRRFKYGGSLQSSLGYSPLSSRSFEIKDGLERTPKTRSFREFKLNCHRVAATPSPKSSKGSSRRWKYGGLLQSNLRSSPLFSCSFEIEDGMERTPNSRFVKGYKLHCHRIAATLSPKSSKGISRGWKYGGSLPLILRDLETGSDIDRSLDLWVGKLTSKEQTIILKEQRDWRCALSVFRWMRAQQDYVPNVIHYNVVFRILGRAQQWDELRLLWIEMGKDGVFPTNNTYGMLVDVYGKAGLVKEALLWIKHMRVRGIFPDEVTMNTAIRVLKDAGEYDRAEKIFKDWCSGLVELGDLDLNSVASDSDLDHISSKHFLLTELFKAGGRIPPPKISAGDEEGLVRKPRLASTYNTLIDLYGKAGRLGDASNAFAEMLRSGVVPDAFTFNTMIHICGSRGHLSEAESLLSKMEERRISPDIKTFNIFLSLYGKVGNIDAVISFYRKIKEVGLLPDVVTHRTILQILCERKMIQEVEDVINEMEKSGACIDEHSLPVVMKMYIEGDILDRARNFLERHCTNAAISSKIYAAIIDAYAEKGLWTEAEFVFSEKRDLGRKDTVEYNVMIKAYGRAKRYDKALSLFGSMKTNGIWPDECTYNSLIQMLSGGELLDSARDLLAKMKDAGFTPRCATFSAVIASCVRSNMVEDAIDVFQEMIRAGVEPNEVVYGSLINAFAEDGKVEEALNYFHLMEESGLAANQIIFTSLIKAYGKVGCWKEAHELYEKMKGLEGGPDVVASNCMIDLCADLGMAYEAESIFNHLKETGRADVVSFTTMMHLYKNMGMLDKAIDVAQEMQHSGLLDDCASFGNAMSSYAANGQLRECGELLHQMLQMRILPDAATFRVMLTMLKKGGLPVESVTQLNLLYEDGKPYARQAIITSVFSVVGLHDVALNSCEIFTKPGLDLDSSIYNVAIYAYGTCGMLEGVKRIYRQMNFGEIELNESLFRAVINAYRDAGKHDLAEMVNQEMRFSFQSQEMEHQEMVNHDSDVESESFSDMYTSGQHSGDEC
ncbi:hypothetical protein AAC387_Pa05g1445 [Persea americana]